MAAVPERPRVIVAPLRDTAARYAYVLVALTAAVVALILRAQIQPYDSRAGMAKAMVAGIAIACVVYEGRRVRRGRPLSERSKRVAGLMLAVWPPSVPYAVTLTRVAFASG